MSESEKLRSNQSLRERVRRGCVIAFGVVILALVLCYSSLWMFARYGGEWATSSDMPIPENSRFIMATYTTYEDSHYQSLSRLFINHDSPENLRQWFIDKGISMTPIALDFDSESVIEYDGYYGTIALLYPRSHWQELHDFAARYTSDWWSDVLPSCHAVYVYYSMEAVSRDFPDADIPRSGTLIMIRTCWPDIN